MARHCGRAATTSMQIAGGGSRVNRDLHCYTWRRSTTEPHHTVSGTTVSLVIPVPNEGPRVAATLDSVFAGTRLPDEIIVADGRSEDDTAAYCER